MPVARKWNVDDDLKIKTMRINGATWQEIADEMGLKRDTVLNRGRAKLNVKAPQAVIIQIQPSKTKHTPRGALPAGAMETWGAISKLPWSCVPR